MKRIIWYPLISALLIGVSPQAIPPATLSNTQVSTKEIQENLISSPLFARVSKTNIANISQLTKGIDEKTALNLVWRLPQVQRKAREIYKLSKGSIKVAAMVDGSPTTDEPYYKIRIYEDQPDHNTTIYWFRVLNTTGVIEALDVIENKYISLEEWKEQLSRRR